MGNKDNTLDSIDLDELLSIFWKWSWLIFLSGIVIGFIAYFICINITPIYEAKTTILVNEASPDQAVDYSSLMLSSELSQTYAQMIVKNPILLEVSKRLDIRQINPLTVEAKTVPNTQLINITVKSSEAEKASKIANEIVVVFSENLQKIQSARFTTSKESINTRILDIEKQILETSKLIALNEDTEQKLLQTAKLDLLKQTHSSLLQSYDQISLSELTTDFSKDFQSVLATKFSESKKELENQIKTVESQILEITKLISSDENVEEKIQLTAKLDFYKQTYTNLLQSYEQVQLTESQTISTIVQIEPAAVPEDPIQPKVLLYSALAMIMGIILTSVVVLYIGVRDDTLKTAEDIANQLSIPVIGLIAHYKNNLETPITESNPRVPVSEAFRNLRTNLLYATNQQGLPIRTILVTSIMAGDGKSTICANLGVVLAQNGRNVTLVDADLRRPMIHEILGLENNFGLSDVFELDESQLLSNGLLQTTRINNLSVVTAGNIPNNPSELLGTEKMRSIIKVLDYCSEFILIDTPPVYAVTDASVLLPFVDGVLLVMRPGTTKLSVARQIISQFQRIGANILGIVVNNYHLGRLNNRYYYDQRYEYLPSISKNISGKRK